MPAKNIINIDMRERNSFAVSALLIEKNGPISKDPNNGSKNSDKHKILN